MKQKVYIVNLDILEPLNLNSKQGRKIRYKELKSDFTVFYSVKICSVVGFRDLQARVINHFGKSLEYGCEYIYQSMPRMLSVWLDCGAQLAQEIKPDGNTIANLAEKKAHMVKLTEIIGK